MAEPTYFTTSTSNPTTIYNNTDLSSIFAPNFPYNTDYGYSNFGFSGSGRYSSGYFNKMNNNSTTANSFTKETNNNIVNIGIDGNGNSYFSFTRNGIYTLNFAYNLTNVTTTGTAITSTTYNYYIRFTTNTSDAINTFGDLTYYYIEGNGNSSNSVVGSPQSVSTDNQILIYNNGSLNTGYPVFESKYSTTTSTIVPSLNFYTISITFLVTGASDNTPYYIYPQYVSMNTLNSAWTWSWKGNWSVRKLYDSTSIPPFPDTNYKISTGTDLNNIFASIYPQNIQYGTVNFGLLNYSVATSYYNMKDINTNSNSFIPTGGNLSNTIVSTGITSSGASYFNFGYPGTYNLTMSYKLDTITTNGSSISAYTTLMNMRLNNSELTDFDITIPFFFDNTFSLSNNGNSYNTTGSFSSLETTNLIRMNRKPDTREYNAGYPILRSSYINLATSSGTTTVTPRKNIYTLSITVKVPNTYSTTTPLQIFPQHYIGTYTSYTWKWSGNWMVTKISNL
jgi:hypothetical protein